LAVPRPGRHAPACPQGSNMARMTAQRAAPDTLATFRSQVGSYLQPEHLDTYGSREAWDALQMQVVDLLEKAAS